jgi:hypothetical protein
MLQNAFKRVEEDIHSFFGDGRESLLVLSQKMGVQGAPAMAQEFVASSGTPTWKLTETEAAYTDGERLLQRLFNETELINVVDTASDDLKPKGCGVSKTMASWTDDILGSDISSLEAHKEAGAWFRPNPLDGGGVRDANVTAFRYVLVESDKLPIDMQSRVLWKLKEMGVPIVAVTHSGGKSLHALVLVECQTLELYQEVAGRLLNALAPLGVDRANKNPSRLSRLPGVKRGEKWQRLIFLEESELGPLSMEVLEDVENTCGECLKVLSRDNVPKSGQGTLIPNLSGCMIRASDLANLNVPKRPRLLDEWFCEADLGYVYAPRGVGKTWFVMGLAAAISQMQSFGRWKPGEKKAKALYVDGEMPLGLTKHRSSSLNLGAGPVTLLHHELMFDQFGASLNIGLESHRKAITDLLLEHSFNVLILDNLSSLAMGVVENKGEDYEPIGDWLLELRRRKITVIVVHHAGRGGQMRGHSKREDACSWILELREAKVEGDEGAKFLSHFAKPSRNTGEPVPDLLWHITTGPRWEDTRIRCELAQTTDYETFIKHIEEGVERQKDIAGLMNKPEGTISKWAKRAVMEKRIKKSGANLLPCSPRNMHSDTLEQEEDDL